MRLFHNARIYTLDPHQPFVTAVLVEDGVIRAVGADESLLAEVNPAKDAINLNGKTILPGLIDAHIHLEHFAQYLRHVNCETATRKQCLDRIKAKADQLPDGQWILGHGWNQNDWSDGYGNAADLDTIAPNHPVYLTSKSLHSAWVNSNAMHLAAIDETTPDPEGGKIMRDAFNKPAGILWETAVTLVNQHIPSPTIDDRGHAIEDAQSALWKMGITGVHDFDQSSCFAALQQLSLQDRLRLRVLKSIPLVDLEHAIAIGLRTGFGDQFIQIGSIKMFMDGALGQQTAAMLSPYDNNPSNRGILMLSSNELLEYGKLATMNGLSLAIHAIGDQANRHVLDALQHLREFEAQKRIYRQRHRIEHVQNIHTDDQIRIGNLDIIASMQPIHATSDMDIASKFWGQRTSSAYAWRSLLKLNTRFAFGSDAPVESPNPFWGLHAAVTRQRVNGLPAVDGWHPEQRISLLQALHGFTSGPAYAARQEHCQGRLMPGFFADLIVLEKDPFLVPVSDLHALKPSATMVGGRWVWKSDDYQSDF
jgi:predicted amidohydrolase YtcJ